MCQSVSQCVVYTTLSQLCVVWKTFSSFLFCFIKSARQNRRKRKKTFFLARCFVWCFVVKSVGLLVSFLREKGGEEETLFGGF